MCAESQITERPSGSRRPAGGSPARGIVGLPGSHWSSRARVIVRLKPPGKSSEQPRCECAGRKVREARRRRAPARNPDHKGPGGADGCRARQRNRAGRFGYTEVFGEAGVVDILKTRLQRRPVHALS